MNEIVNTDTEEFNILAPEASLYARTLAGIIVANLPYKDGEQAVRDAYVASAGRLLGPILANFLQSVMDDTRVWSIDDA